MDMNSEKCQCKMKSYWWKSILWTYSCDATADFSSFDFLDTEAGNQRSRCNFSYVIFNQLKIADLQSTFSLLMWNKIVSLLLDTWNIIHVHVQVQACMWVWFWQLCIWEQGIHSLASSHFYLANNPRIAKNAERHQFKQVQILIISSKY